MKEITCAECGIVFGLGEGFIHYRRKDHRTFWCPNGHTQVYKAETDADRYKRLYEEANARSVSVREEYESLKRSAAKAKKELKSLKLRTAAGVCPCCTRTVSQLAAHMASKHPEYRELAGLAPLKQLVGEVEDAK